MNKDVLAPQLCGFVSGVIDTPSKGVSRYTSAVLLLFTLALSACGGEDLPPPENLLAVAYINSDGLLGYSVTGDILIAGLYDTNDDGFPNAGDTVIYGEFPLGFQGEAAAGFTVTTHAVTQVGNVSASVVGVFVGDTVLAWNLSDGCERFQETALPYDAFSAQVLLLDCSTSPRFDELLVLAPSIGQPDGADQVNLGQQAAADLPFLDVQIFINGDT